MDQNYIERLERLTGVLTKLEAIRSDAVAQRTGGYTINEAMEKASVKVAGCILMTCNEVAP